MRYFNDLSCVRDRDSLWKWLRIEHDNGEFEVYLRQGEFDRIWRIHAGEGAVLKTPDFIVRFELGTRNGNPVCAYYQIYNYDWVSDSEPIASSCTCSGSDLWRHPSGCKCSWAKRDEIA